MFFSRDILFATPWAAANHTSLRSPKLVLILTIQSCTSFVMRGIYFLKRLPYFIHQERHIHTKKQTVSRSNAQRKTTYIVTLIKLRRKQSIRSRLHYSETHRHDSEPWLTPIGRAAPSPLTTVWIYQRQRCILQSTSDFSQPIYSALISEWPVSAQDFGLAQSSQHWGAKTQSWVSILHIIKSSWLQFPWGFKKNTHTHTHKGSWNRFAFARGISKNTVGCGGQGVFGVLHPPQASRGLLIQQQYREETAVSQLICPQGFIYNKIPEVQKWVNLKSWID